MHVENDWIIFILTSCRNKEQEAGVLHIHVEEVRGKSNLEVTDPQVMKFENAPFDSINVGGDVCQSRTVSSFLSW